MRAIDRSSRRSYGFAMKRFPLLLVLALSMLPLPAQANDPGGTPTPTGQATTPAKNGATTAADSPTILFATALASARTLIAAKQFVAAITALKIIDKNFPNNADINNLLGFASRNINLYDDSNKYYAKALKIDPKNLGALEYQGELFLKQNKLTTAKINLSKLKKLCGTSCEQYLDLQKAILAK